MALNNHSIESTAREEAKRGKRRDRRERSWRGISIWQPYSWPRSWRRIALLTLPLAVMLWLVAAIFVCLRIVYRDARKPIRRFWSAPSRRRSGYGYFSY